ncbi:hypothetical protein VNI00_017132 [Paramarasmius palmivorus]|uniref:Uncharacterized protein n=1 Tax=Paramarasmius palmivorus TaxID=297713 RepID=A0AAW0B9S5_9AGAR
METKVFHEMEMEGKLLCNVHNMEQKLNITRWVFGSPEWMSYQQKAKDHDYQRALNQLEGLVVACIFEMARLNVAGTGYKMRQAIVSAMKTRSAAIRSAIERFNKAAQGLDPPQPTLEWNDVVNCSFLADFDFLRETGSDVQRKAWTLPANRELMTSYFKVLCAEEELERLHIEIRRLITYITEELTYSQQVLDEVGESDPAFAYHIHLKFAERGRFHALHIKRLRAITELEGFNPANKHWFAPGTGMKRQVNDTKDASDTVGHDMNEESSEDVDSDTEEDTLEDMERAEAVLNTIT